MGLESRMFDWKSFSTVLRDLKHLVSHVLLLVCWMLTDEKLSTIYGKKSPVTFKTILPKQIAQFPI